MKLRIKGNSLRLRVTPTEVARLLKTGRIEETIHFSPEREARLTYALEHAPNGNAMSLRYQAQEITVVLSSETAHHWVDGDQVGIDGDFAVMGGELKILVEKDFACLDESHADNQDTFPNPNRGKVC
jgi:hypothetical protein